MSSIKISKSLRLYIQKLQIRNVTEIILKNFSFSTKTGQILMTDISRYGYKKNFKKTMLHDDTHISNIHESLKSSYNCIANVNTVSICVKYISVSKKRNSCKFPRWPLLLRFGTKIKTETKDVIN